MSRSMSQPVSAEAPESSAPYQQWPRYETAYRFLAVAGYVWRPTIDRRILRRPAEPLLAQRPCPVIALIPAMSEGLAGVTVQVGTVEAAMVADDAVVVTGLLDGPRLATDPVWWPAVLEDLRGGRAWFQINASVAELGSGTFLSFVDWQVTALWIGDRPAWKLPPVVLTELTEAP